LPRKKARLYNCRHKNASRIKTANILAICGPVIFILDKSKMKRLGSGTLSPTAKVTISTWVKLKKYSELTGDSPAAVHARRRSGKWRDGIQCKVIDDSLWINIPEVEGWLVNWSKGAQPV